MTTAAGHTEGELSCVDSYRDPVPPIPPPQRPSPFDADHRWITVGIVGQVTLIAFETIAVATAMPTAVAALDGLRHYGWSFTGFMIANVVALVLSAIWCDRLGPRRSLIVGLCAFTAGLVIAGTAVEMAQFVIGRVFQGFGAGLAVVALYVAIGGLYPERLRPRIFALVSAAWVLPSLIGPFVAGALASAGLWRWVFLGLLPVLAAISFAVWQVIRRSQAPDHPKASGYGRLGYGAAAAAGLVLIQLGLERASTGSALMIGAMLAGGAGLLVVALRTLWPRGTARMRPGVPAVVLSRGLLAGAFFGMESLVPLTLATVHGLSPVLSGLPLLVGAVAWSTASFVQGRSALPRHVLVRIGGVLVLSCAVLLPLSVWVPGGSWIAYPVWMLGGAGMGLALSSLGVLLLDLSPAPDRGSNSAALQLSEAVMNSLTIGLGGALVASALAGAMSFQAAVTVHDLVLAAMVLWVTLGAWRTRVDRGTTVAASAA